MDHTMHVARPIASASSESGVSETENASMDFPSGFTFQSGGLFSARSGSSESDADHSFGEQSTVHHKMHAKTNHARVTMIGEMATAPPGSCRADLVGIDEDERDHTAATTESCDRGCEVDLGSGDDSDEDGLRFSI